MFCDGFSFTFPQLDIVFTTSISRDSCFHERYNHLLFLHPDTPLLVRSSSDSALAPPYEKKATPTPDLYNGLLEKVSAMPQ